MRLIKVFNEGVVMDEILYTRLMNLDLYILPDFRDCGNEFKENRDWWVGIENGKIISYCGCLYTETFCLFNRAWVHPKYRGNGIQKQLIKVRLNAAKSKGLVTITYTTIDNPASANSLIKKGFKLYIPSWYYAGKDKLYFRKD